MEKLVIFEFAEYNTGCSNFDQSFKDLGIRSGLISFIFPNLMKWFK